MRSNGPRQSRLLAASGVLERLREQLAAVAQGRSEPEVVKTAWSAVDEALPGGGLARGALHEWIGTVETSDESSASDDPAGRDENHCLKQWHTDENRGLKQCRAGGYRRSISAGAGYRRQPWNPPLGILQHLVRQSQASSPASGIVWIGPAVQPYPIALAAHAPAVESLLARSIFVRAVRPVERLFVTEMVLRSRAAKTVIADGSGFNLTATRRLQLAAETGSTLCLIARPPWDEEELSAARTRWRIRGTPSPGRRQRWIVELLRCKGMQSIGPDAYPSWTLERDHATCHVSLASDVVDGRRPSPAAAGWQRSG